MCNIIVKIVPSKGGEEEFHILKGQLVVSRSD